MASPPGSNQLSQLRIALEKLQKQVNEQQQLISGLILYVKDMEKQNEEKIHLSRGGFFSNLFGPRCSPQMATSNFTATEGVSRSCSMNRECACSFSDSTHTPQGTSSKTSTSIQIPTRELKVFLADDDGMAVVVDMIISHVKRYLHESLHMIHESRGNTSFRPQTWSSSSATTNPFPIAPSRISLSTEREDAPGRPVFIFRRLMGRNMTLLRDTYDDVKRRFGSSPQGRPRAFITIIHNVQAGDSLTLVSPSSQLMPPPPEMHDLIALICDVECDEQIVHSSNRNNAAYKEICEKLCSF